MDLFETLADITRPMTQPDPEFVKVEISEITFNEEIRELTFTARYQYSEEEEWAYLDKDFIIEKEELEQILISRAEEI